jgi:hypothetical protein
MGPERAVRTTLAGVEERVVQPLREVRHRFRVSHAKPYDARTPEVWERSDSAQEDVERPRPLRNPTHGERDRLRLGRVPFAEEANGEVK